MVLLNLWHRVARLLMSEPKTRDKCEACHDTLILAPPEWLNEMEAAGHDLFRLCPEHRQRVPYRLQVVKDD